MLKREEVHHNTENYNQDITLDGNNEISLRTLLFCDESHNISTWIYLICNENITTSMTIKNYRNIHIKSFIFVLYIVIKELLVHIDTITVNNQQINSNSLNCYLLYKQFKSTYSVEISFTSNKKINVSISSDNQIITLTNN